MVSSFSDDLKAMEKCFCDLWRFHLLNWGIWWQSISEECWTIWHWNNQWISISSINQARNGHAAVSIGESIFVIGGRNISPLKSVEMYDTRSNKWMEITPLNTPRYCLAAAVCGNSIFAIGGRENLFDVGALETVEKLSVYCRQWSLSLHKYCSPFLKRQIECLLMMCLCDTQSRNPLHPQCALAFIPKDILFIIFGFLSTSE